MISLTGICFFFFQLQFFGLYLTDLQFVSLIERRCEQEAAMRTSASSSTLQEERSKFSMRGQWEAMAIKEELVMLEQ
jgi:hypothetical protein